MSLLIGCPVILPPTPDLLDSWNHRPTFAVVNGEERAWSKCLAAAGSPLAYFPGENLGVSCSWNIIMGNARAWGYSHVALMSQGTILQGGTARLNDLVETYADERGLLTDFAWHCIVLSTALWEQVGRFDEGFSPAYYEDADYLRRMELLGLHTPDNPMRKLTRQQLDGTETQGATLTAGLISERVYGTNAARYELKWGGPPTRETFDRPYNRNFYGEDNPHAP